MPPFERPLDGFRKAWDETRELMTWLQALSADLKRTAVRSRADIAESQALLKSATEQMRARELSRVGDDRGVSGFS